MACLIAFVRVELRREAPLLNLRLFNLRGYGLSVIIAVVQSVGMFECLVLLPLLVQTVLGYNPIWTGLALLCTAAFASRAVGRQGAGPPRPAHGGGHRFVAYRAGHAGTGHAQRPCIDRRGVRTDDGAWRRPRAFLHAGDHGGLNALPEPMVTQGAAMNNISRRLVASLAIVIASLWLEFRLNSAGPLATPSAISEVFIVTGVLILLALPVRGASPLTTSAPRPSPTRSNPDNFSFEV